MPFTPFHFGPGLALHAAAPRRISFMAFCAANVVIDIEPLSYMLARDYPVHRFLHTYIGASFVWLAMSAVFMWLAAPIGAVFRALRLRPLTLGQVALGSALGAYSHIVLDSVMHQDIRPFAPFSDANPLLGLVWLSTLHLFCIVAGVVGLAVLGIRRAMRPED